MFPDRDTQLLMKLANPEEYHNLAWTWKYSPTRTGVFMGYLLDVQPEEEFYRGPEFHGGLRYVGAHKIKFQGECMDYRHSDESLKDSHPWCLYFCMEYMEITPFTRFESESLLDKYVADLKGEFPSVPEKVFWMY